MFASILIPTLESRRPLFDRVYAKLAGQIRACGWEDQIEIVWLRDRGELSTGAKRNLLMDRARGDFVVSVDDDDDVSDRYISLIGQALQAHPDVDCVGIKGEMTFRGRYRRPFVYSIAHPAYRSERGVYLRPPHHLNPIRRTIAVKYRFLDIRRTEDTEWALQMSRAGALRKEVLIDEVIYHYKSRRWWGLQWAIDKTEWIRHPLGLQLVNRFEIKRRFGSRRSRHSV